MMVVMVMMTMLVVVAAVSYTHLDVYKRQPVVCVLLSQVYGAYSLTPDPNGIVGEGLY